MSAPGRFRLRSFVYAWRGLRVLVATQPNARIHAVASALVIAAGFTLRVDTREWCWLVVAMALVWMAEAFNTALEFLADEVSLAQRERIGRAKDLAAGAVLCASLGAAAIGLIIFVPHLAARFGG